MIAVLAGAEYSLAEQAYAHNGSDSGEVEGVVLGPLRTPAAPGCVADTEVEGDAD